MEMVLHVHFNAFSRGLISHKLAEAKEKTD